MKKKLIFGLFAALFFSPSFSQPFVGLGAGMSTKAPLIELQTGYETKSVQVQGGFIAHLSSQVDNGVSFYGKIAPVFKVAGVKIAPGIGYSYNLKSTDKKQLNSTSSLFSLYGYKELGRQGELFAGVTHADKTIFLTVGLRCLIAR
jgi:hypothetical protein